MNRVIPILVVLAIAILAIGPIAAALNERAADPNALLRPANAAVVVTLPDQLDVQWSDRADNESMYQIERSRDGVTWEPAASLPADTTHFSDTGLDCGTTYYYRVRSYRAADDRLSSYTDTFSAKTGLCPPSAPVG